MTVINRLSAALLAAAILASPAAAENPAIQAMHEYLEFPTYEAGIIVPQQISKDIFDSVVHWQAAMFRTAEDLRGLADAAGLNVVEIRGAVHYPPCATAARFLAPADLWLGRHMTFGSAFIAASATKRIETATAKSQ